MKTDFEKLDEWMMEITQNQRAQSVPQNDLENFREEVIKKITAPEISGMGSPYAMLGFAAGFTFLVVMASIIFILHAHITKPAPEEKPAAKKESVSEGSPASLTRGSEAENRQVPKVVSGQPPVSEPPKASLSQSDIIAEIEALRELGAWDEKDEEEAGIPVDVSFADVQSYLENQPSVTPAALQ